MGDVKVWFFSAIAAFISGASMSILVMVIDPLKFNFTNGIGNLAAVATLSGVLKVAAYLATSPLPKTLLSTVVTKTDQVTTTPESTTTKQITKTETTETPKESGAA